MDSSPAATSILDTLRTVEFRLGLKGYNVDEVDEYLDRAAQEAEALQENVRQLNERLRQAGDRISLLEREKRSAPVEEPAPVAATAPAALEVAPSDETLQRTLILAQKFVDQIKRESEAEDVYKRQRCWSLSPGRPVTIRRATPRRSWPPGRRSWSPMTSAAPSDWTPS